MAGSMGANTQPLAGSSCFWAVDHRPLSAVRHGRFSYFVSSL